MEEKIWIVLYVKGVRVASAENTQENIAYLKSQFYLSHIQTDITGTVHYNVLGIRRTNKKH